MELGFKLIAETGLEYSVFGHIRAHGAILVFKKLHIAHV